MARIRGHRPLDLAQPLLVKRARMAFGTRVFKLGETLPWRELGLKERLVRQLHDQRKIGHEKPADRNGAEDLRAPPVAAIAPKPVAKQQQPARR